MLLDTHALIWLLAGDARLGRAARDRIEAEREADTVLVSPYSFFEVGTLARRGRIDLGASFARWSATIIGSPGITLAPLDVRIAGAAGQLGDDVHGDPGDRILIATARRLDMPLLTADAKILAYAAAGHLAAIDARL